MKNLIALFALLIAAVGCTSTPTDTRPVYQVDTVDAFLAAIGPDRIIELKPGVTYRLDTADHVDGAHHRWKEKFQSVELVIHHCSSLTIRGGQVADGGEKAHVVTGYAYPEVLSFEACDGLRIDNLRLGHDATKHSCAGAVIGMVGCKNVRIHQSLLYGCGTQGLVLKEVDGLIFSDSIIEECNSGMMTAIDCRNLNFVDSIFRDTNGYFGFEIVRGIAIVFEDCEILGISTGEHLGLFDYRYFAPPSGQMSDITFIRGRIAGNRAGHLADPKSMLKLVGTTLEDNDFTAGVAR